MSQTIDLHEMMLAELREFGTALAARIVVTPVAAQGAQVREAKRSPDRRAAASSTLSKRHIDTGTGRTRVTGASDAR